MKRQDLGVLFIFSKRVQMALSTYLYKAGKNSNDELLVLHFYVPALLIL